MKSKWARIEYGLTWPKQACKRPLLQCSHPWFLENVNSLSVLHMTFVRHPIYLTCLAWIDQAQHSPDLKIQRTSFFFLEKLLHQTRKIGFHQGIHSCTKQNQHKFIREKRLPQTLASIFLQNSFPRVFILMKFVDVTNSFFHRNGLYTNVPKKFHLTFGILRTCLSFANPPPRRMITTQATGSMNSFRT